MKPPPFDYHDPRTVSETVSLLSKLDNAKVLAGGQSLMPMMNLRLAQPDDVVDINRVDELAGIDWDEQAGVVRVGAMVRQRTAERDLRLAARLPLMAEALGNIGHFQTRNRGTIGGSIAHLDPAAELVAVASVSDATVRLTSVRGQRHVAFADYPQGLLTPDIEQDELVVSIDFPEWPSGHGYAFVEFARRHGDFAIVAVAALMDVSAERRISRVAVSVIGLGPVPVRVHELEERLRGQEATSAALDQAAETVAALPASGDDRAPADYRRHLALHLTRRALHTAAARARTTDREAVR